MINYSNEKYMRENISLNCEVLFFTSKIVFSI
jgi:hypothetical protein